jgi:hypothetical protein
MVKGGLTSKFSAKLKHGAIYRHSPQEEGRG